MVALLLYLLMMPLCLVQVPAYQLMAARLVTADLLNFRQFALLSWQADNYRPLHKMVLMALS